MSQNKEKRDNSGHYGDFEHGRSTQIAYELFFEMLVGIERTIHDLGEFKLFVNNNKMCFRKSKVKSAVFYERASDFRRARMGCKLQP